MRGSWLVVGALSMLAPMVWAHGGIPQEIAAIDEKLEAQPGRAEWLIERASLRHLRGDFGAALADLNEAGELRPDEDRICFLRGMVLSKLGRFGDAEADLTSYLMLHPSHARALAARAELYVRSGRPDLARADYQAALAVAPSVDLFLALGRLEEEQKALDQAAACYTKGLGALHEAVVLKRALIRVETERRNYDRAIALLDTMLANRAFKADALLDRADIYDKAGKHTLAQQDRLDALSQIDRGLLKRPSALRRLARARALLALDRDDEGVDELETVVDQAPRLEEAREMLRRARERR